MQLYYIERHLLTLLLFPGTMLRPNADESPTFNNLHVINSKCARMSDMLRHNTTALFPMRQRPPDLRAVQGEKRKMPCL